MTFRKFGNERSVVTPDDSQDQGATIEAVGAQTECGEPEPTTEHYDIPTIAFVDEEGHLS